MGTAAGAVVVASIAGLPGGAAPSPAAPETPVVSRQPDFSSASPSLEQTPTREPTASLPSDAVEIVFTTLYDETLTLAVEVPVRWFDVQTEVLEYRSGDVPHIAASEDIEEFRSLDYLVSGVDVFAVPVDPELGLTLDEAIGTVLRPDYMDVCEFFDFAEYDEATYSGIGYHYTNCGGAGTDQHIWSLQTAGRDDYVIVAALQLARYEGEDYQVIFDRVFQSFGFAN